MDLSPKKAHIYKYKRFFLWAFKTYFYFGHMNGCMDQFGCIQNCIHTSIYLFIHPLIHFPIPSKLIDTSMHMSNIKYKLKIPLKGPPVFKYESPLWRQTHPKLTKLTQNLWDLPKTYQTYSKLTRLTHNLPNLTTLSKSYETY